MALDQLVWLDNTLNSSSSKKYLLTMHIFPGLNYFKKDVSSNPIQEFWMANYTQRYLDIIYKHQDKIIYNIGSHVHRVALKAPMSSNHTDINLKIYASPSISPVYDNNPGYSFIELDDSDYKVNEITLKFLRLYVVDFMFGARVWNEIKLSLEMGIDLNDASQIRSYYQKMMNNPSKWADFESITLGHGLVTRVISKALMPAWIILGETLKNSLSLCLNSFYDRNDELLKECAANSKYQIEF